MVEVWADVVATGIKYVSPDKPSLRQFGNGDQIHVLQYVWWCR